MSGPSEKLKDAILPDDRDHPDQTVRIKYWAVCLRNTEQSKRTRAARKMYNKELKELLPQADWLALWKHLADTGYFRLVKSPHQPDYLIVYDETWGRVIESYFVREKGVPEEDEPDDTLNGPIDKDRVQEFIEHLVKERYPEKERFKIRRVSADSMEALMSDIKWVLDND